MDFLKTVTGKVVSGIVALAVILAVISWWRMDDATKHMLLSGTGKIFGWLGVMLVLPWALFFAAGWVGQFESNQAAKNRAQGRTSMTPSQPKIFPVPER